MSRELNEQVAERVMRWEPASGGYYYIDPSSRTRNQPARMVCMEPGDGAAPYWSPWTDIAAAWEVWEKLPEPRRLTDGEDAPMYEHVPSDCRFYVLCGGGSYGAHTDFSNDVTGWGATPTEAICRAALLAVGVMAPAT